MLRLRGALFGLLTSACVSGQTAELQLHDWPGHGAFEVRGVAPEVARRVDWGTVFTVRVVPDVGVSGALQPVAGAHRPLRDGARFVPRFPLTPGVTYRVRAALPFRVEVERSFRLDAKRVAATVERVYPSGGTIPENTLRLYLHFSTPMRRGGAVRSVKLLDEAGELVHEPFLTGPTGELWDREMTRLTVLFDPGRLKRGVGPNRKWGPALVEGQQRTLVVETGMRSASGAPLLRRFEKTYLIGPPERTAVDPDAWSIAPPRAGTRDPLVVRFPRVMDHGMLSHAIAVRPAGAARGGAVLGKVEVVESETSWRFVPAEPWSSGRHELRFPDALEDVAGNNVRSALDSAVRSTPSVRHSVRTIEFSVSE